MKTDGLDDVRRTVWNQRHWKIRERLDIDSVALNLLDSSMLWIPNWQVDAVESVDDLRLDADACWPDLSARVDDSSIGRSSSPRHSGVPTQLLSIGTPFFDLSEDSLRICANYNTSCMVTCEYKKAQHRSWHTAKLNNLYHLKWNINAWDTAMHLHGRHFVRHLEIFNPICIKLCNLCSVSLRTFQWKTKSLY